MRIIVFTGKGGVGKTSIAAATALRIAKSGARTLVMSTDPAHSLADSFESEITGEPVEIAPKLYGLQVDAQARLEEQWHVISDFVTRFLSWAGADPVAAEEITILPGIEEIFSLTDIRKHAASGDYDCVVVDCAPTAETLRLLSLPEIARWYIERVFPVERRVVKAMRPVLRRMTNMPLASEAFYASVEKLYRNLEGVGQMLTDASTSSVRLVVNPEKMVIAEAQRMFTYLSLFSYRVDAVIVNRLLPDSISDPYFAKWKDIQARHLTEVHESFDPVPVLTAKLYDEEMVGTSLLDVLGDEVYGERDAAAVLHLDEPMSVVKVGNQYVLSLRLPHADGRLELSRRGEELICTVGSHRRAIVLPASLRRREVVDAGFEGPDLKIRFGKEDEQ